MFEMIMVNSNVRPTRANKAMSKQPKACRFINGRTYQVFAKKVAPFMAHRLTITLLFWEQFMSEILLTIRHH